MWVFGYGSLIWDGWEKKYCCLRRVVAELPGFRRAFNKASIKNWGTKDRPGPTLNLEADSSASCKGIAFEFPEDKHSEVFAYLKKREGGFEFSEQNVTLEDGNTVHALFPVYSGKNLLRGKSLIELAAMAKQAVGDCGRCVDYITNIFVKLAELGIKDRAVEEFRRALDQTSRDP